LQPASHQLRNLDTCVNHEREFLRFESKAGSMKEQRVRVDLEKTFERREKENKEREEGKEGSLTWCIKRGKPTSLGKTGLQYTSGEFGGGGQEEDRPLRPGKMEGSKETNGHSLRGGGQTCVN